jgi:hypothetical protein
MTSEPLYKNSRLTHVDCRVEAVVVRKGESYDATVLVLRRESEMGHIIL